MAQRGLEDNPHAGEAHTIQKSGNVNVEECAEKTRDPKDAFSSDRYTREFRFNEGSVILSLNM